MAKQYCPSCGYSNEYSLTAPNFCGGCGKPFGGLPVFSFGAIKKKRKIRPIAEEEEYEEEEEENAPNPNVGLPTEIKLQFVLDNAPTRVRFEEVIGTEVGSQGYRRDNYLNVSLAERTKQIQEAAKSSVESKQVS